MRELEASREVIRLKTLEERRKSEQELALAQETQESLLPRVLPQFENFSIHAFNHPTRYVGGDFYDFLQLPAGSEAGLRPADSGPDSGAGLRPADRGTASGAGLRPADRGTCGEADLRPADSGTGGEADLRPADSGPEWMGVLADVSGKGMPAALLSSMVLGALSMEFRSGTQPQEALNRVNQLLCEKSSAFPVRHAFSFSAESRRHRTIHQRGT